MRQVTRTDTEARIDAAASIEVQRVDSIMANLTNNPEWLFSMGGAYGKTPMELQNGLGRFSESLRKLHLGIQSMWSPEYSGAENLFRRCDTLEDRAVNIREIAAFIDKNRVDMARGDSESGIFYEPDLTDFDPTRYRVKKQKLGFWQKFLPTRAIPLGAQDTKYTMYEGTGATDPSSPGKMTGVNYVGVRNERFTNPVESATIGYMLTTDDQRKAAYANEPLLDELLIATRQAVGRELDKTAWLGNLMLGLNGAINSPGVSNLQAVLDSGVRSWKSLTKSNDAVFSDINAATGKIAVDSKENWTPEDTKFIMLIDRTTKNALNRRMATGTDTTLLEFIRRNTDAGIEMIGVLPNEFIAGTGPSGSDQALFYPFDPQVLRYRVNPDVIWAPMQWQDLTMKFPGEIIYGSVEVIYPVAMVEVYDI
jgi:hypothetical protein